MFDDNGNLKIGKINVEDIDEFKNIFVKDFPNIKHREALYSKFLTYNSKFNLSNFALWIQWIGGSFTTKKEFPNDIDVVNIVKFDNLEYKNIVDYMILNSLLRRYNSKQVYNVDSYLVAWCDENDAGYPVYKKWMDYWEDLWSHDRNKNPRGFVVLEQHSEEIK